MDRVPAFLAVVTVASFSACATHRIDLEPDSPLGQARAHLAAEQYAEARQGFAAWLDANQEDDRAWLGLGAAWEGLDQLDSARSVYTHLLARPVPGSVRRHLQGRLRLIDRRMLQQAAREAVVQEASLANTEPIPNAIAIFPFRYLGTNPDLVPLERALAVFMVTDLTHVQSLILLERAAVQFLIDEMRLSEAGRVDPQTAARSGRLLQAEYVVQGTIDDPPGTERIRLLGTAVRTTTGVISAAAAAEDELMRLFDLEKELLFQLLDRMGISITPLERERIAERPTASMQAFLAFGRGIEREDAGDFVGAVAEYQTAIAVDPGFAAAQGRLESAASMATAADTPLDRVATLMDEGSSDLAFVTDFLNAVMGSGMATGDRIQSPRGQTPPGDRDGVGEVGGRDRLGGVGDIVVTVRRP